MLNVQDPILGITEAFLADENPEKMNLGVVITSSLHPTRIALTQPRMLHAFIWLCDAFAVS